MLDLVDREVRVVREVSRRLSPTLAPKFSIFDFLRADEMGLSACVASLLDPNEAHGQGAAFLHLFLEMLEAKGSWFDDLRQAKVAVEARTKGMRRLDIHVRLGRRAIGIENKPWASDQKLQISDYAEFLEKTCEPEGWMLVYLGDREPSADSIDAARLKDYVDAGCMKLVTFRMLAGWLERCAGAAKPFAVRVFIEQMEQFVRKQICGEVDMSESEAVKEIMLESDDSLHAALLVARTLGGVKEHLLQAGLRAPFEKLMHERGIAPVWGGRMLTMGTNTGFGAQFLPDALGYARYEFERAGLNGLFWGIRRRDKLKAGEPDHAATEQLVQCMDQAFGRGVCNAWWYWYSADLTSLAKTDAKAWKAWGSSATPWLLMRSGTLASSFASHVEVVRDVLRGSAAAEIVGLPVKGQAG